MVVQARPGATVHLGAPRMAVKQTEAGVILEMREGTKHGSRRFAPIPPG